VCFTQLVSSRLNPHSEIKSKGTLLDLNGGFRGLQQVTENNVGKSFVVFRGFVLCAMQNY
jgi:hypothetical protein